MKKLPPIPPEIFAQLLRDGLIEEFDVDEQGNKKYRLSERGKAVVQREQASKTTQPSGDI